MSPLPSRSWSWYGDYCVYRYQYLLSTQYLDIDIYQLSTKYLPQAVMLPAMFLLRFGGLNHSQLTFASPDLWVFSLVTVRIPTL